MSEDFVKRLSQFAPDVGDLDRDALLIAAGRASAHPNRGLLALVGLLTVSQLLTLFLLWPATPVAPVPNVPPPLVIEPDPRLQPSEPSSWWLLQSRGMAVEGNLTATVSGSESAFSDAPLHAFARFPENLDN